MKNVLHVFVVAAVLLFAAAESRAAAPTCHPYSSGPYCQYYGTVRMVYVNSGNIILFEFDTPMDPSEPTSVGISGVNSYTTATYNLADNVEYGKLLYSSLLSAQARGATIRVQMRGTHNGYLVVDRIWVYE